VRRLPLDPPRPAGAGLRHQGNAGARRRGRSSGLDLITLLGSPAWNPDQALLLPPSQVDWLQDNHLVFFLLDLAAELDLDLVEIHA
jgi:hypothetical protein